MSIIKKIQGLYEKIILSSLVLAVLIMLFLTLLNIILRLFDSTLLWVEPMVRHLVFLSTFLGGAVASSKNEHIKIDIASKLIKKENAQKIYQIIIHGFTLIVLIYLYRSGVNFYDVEKEYASQVFLGISSSTLVAIIPFGFSLIFIQTVFNLVGVFSKSQTQEHK